MVQAMVAPVDVDAAIAAVREVGYAVLPAIYPTEDVEFFRDAVLELYRSIGSPPARTEEHQTLGPDIEIGPAGIVFHRLTATRPEVIPRLLRPEAVAVLRGVLGDDMCLELPAAVVADSDRPFFDWHTHVGGVDDQTAGYAREYPSFTRSERITMIHYVDGLTPENGPVLVLPRRVDEPTEAPYPATQRDWPGQVEVHCPPGSVLILEQCTWHAAVQRRSPGLRIFIGCYFAGGDVPPSPVRDPSLHLYDGDDELYRSVLPSK